MFNRKKKDVVHKLSDIAVTVKNNDSLRRNCDIAVIDDQSFLSAEKLKVAGFSIHEVGDIDNLKKIESYPIVVCDIEGVGKAFGAKAEGAFVVSEIRKRYPDKYIIAYSTKSFEFTYQPYINKADIAMPKVSSVEQWTEVLDRAIAIVSDPKTRWVRIRQKLIDSNVELYDVFKLEQAYILSILKKNDSLLTDANQSSGLDSSTKDIISIFVTTSLREIIKSIKD
ncbi:MULTISPECIES: hypothetical protein [Citrobacter]|nr:MULTISPECIES: hypothetical protein [Citrobacter]MBA8198200.1 hypothetical protein [Citrobacter freundii]MBR7616807.1 hypothetical protein [Citrobacter braakii]MDL4471781.1 hypothetical protein [Citrobacter braakii]MDL4503510.1 hypothetical protein [Citrobacter braakii]MDM3381489.1 hypothetical protein [Citrobacter sp. Cb003]